MASAQQYNKKKDFEKWATEKVPRSSENGTQQFYSGVLREKGRDKNTSDMAKMEEAIV